jgi:hypothetical protein
VAWALTAQTPIVDVPQMQYARSGDYSIAYQLFGDGELTLRVPRPTKNLLRVGVSSPGLLCRTRYAHLLPQSDELAADRFQD